MCARNAVAVGSGLTRAKTAALRRAGRAAWLSNTARGRRSCPSGPWQAARPYRRPPEVNRATTTTPSQRLTAINNRMQRQGDRDGATTAGSIMVANRRHGGGVAKRPRTTTANSSHLPYRPPHSLRQDRLGQSSRHAEKMVGFVLVSAGRFTGAVLPIPPRAFSRSSRCQGNSLLARASPCGRFAPGAKREALAPFPRPVPLASDGTPFPVARPTTICPSGTTSTK